MIEDINSTTLFCYLILLLLSLILLTLLVLLLHSGLFTSIKEVGTGKPPLGKVVIAYKFQNGPYNEAGQVFTEAAIIAPDNRCLGIYYDDPKMVSPQELRYAVGSILASDISEMDISMRDRFVEKGFKVMTLPEVEYVVQTSFPHVTTLSILIGIHKAYPKLQEYIEERKLCAYPFVEYYDGKDINFYAPLSKQDEFWVSECQPNLDGRGDESVDSDVNTLDTSHSVLDDSVDEARIAPNDVDTSIDSNQAMSKSPKEEVKEDICTLKQDGEVKDDNDDDKDKKNCDDEDNSSSSSFELLKNENCEQEG